MQYLTVVPAYGRDYKTQQEVRDAWEAGKDFQINDASSRWDGSYINKADMPPGLILTVRYHSMRRTCQIGG